MWKTGHSLIKKKIKEERALLAGEMSGHLFFADRWYGFDDAIYASARLVELVAKSDLRLSEMLSDLPKTFSTPEIRVYASDEVKFRIVDEVKAALKARVPIIDIDGVRARFPKGWALVRASNTQAVLVLRFEAETEADLAAIRAEVKDLVAQAIHKLGQ
jgi:phosphomannomutase/phosphoglucomutase